MKTKDFKYTEAEEETRASKNFLASGRKSDRKYTSKKILNLSSNKKLRPKSAAVEKSAKNHNVQKLNQSAKNE